MRLPACRSVTLTYARSLPRSLSREKTNRIIERGIPCKRFHCAGSTCPSGGHRGKPASGGCLCGSARRSRCACIARFAAHRLERAHELLREDRGGDRQVAGAQLSENEGCTWDVAVVDVARDKAKLVVLGHRPDPDLKRDQIGMGNEAAQELE